MQKPVKLILQEDIHEHVIGGHNSQTFELNCSDAPEGVYTVTLPPLNWKVM